MYFHFHCDDQGFDPLAGLFKRTSIEEMLHVEKAAERILFLKGEVKMQASERAAAMEAQSVKEYNEWANESGANADSATKRIFEDLVADEERHHDQFSNEVDNIDRFGEKYLALQTMERSRGGGAVT